MTLASKLQKLRVARRESLQTVADAVGASKAHIWELERGSAKNPSVELLRKLADHYQVSIGQLVGEHPDEQLDDPQLLVMYRQLKDLNDEDRKLLEGIILQMQKRRRDG